MNHYKDPRYISAIIAFAIIIILGWNYIQTIKEQNNIQREKIEQDKRVREDQIAAENEKVESLKEEEAQKKEQERQNRFKDECIANKKAAVKQAEDTVSSCPTMECAQNAVKLFAPGTDYINICMDRKNKGLPTFDY